MSFATKEQLQELTAYMAGQLNAHGVGVYSPVGTIIAYMGTTAPRDYLACDGTVYNIADYTLLANHIAANFGSVDFFGGDGTTTFAVPDLRGEFLRGTGTNSHENQGSGANVGAHQDGTAHPNVGIDQLHYNIITHTQSATVDDALVAMNADHQNISTQKTGNYWARSGTYASNGAITYTSRPTNTSVLYCIAYRDSMEDIVDAVIARLQGG